MTRFMSLKPGALFVLVAGLLLLSAVASAAARSNSPETIEHGQRVLVAVEGDRFITDLRYNTPDNFLKKNVYAPFGLNRCYVRHEMMERLRQVQASLEKKQLRLVFFDCFRPIEVQEKMWELVPDDNYVANPKSGSNHNRGVAIDVGLADSEGKLLPMPTEFDDFTPRAARSYACPPEDAQKCKNRALLEELLTEAGLIGIASEWWHFELPKAKTYPLIKKRD